MSKKECKKINNQSLTASQPIKNSNNELVSSTDEKLKAWYSHYKFHWVGFFGS